MNRLTKTEQMVEVLREVHCNCHSPLREKLEELEFLHGKYSVHVLCEALIVLARVNRGKSQDSPWSSTAA